MAAAVVLVALPSVATAATGAVAATTSGVRVGGVAMAVCRAFPVVVQVAMVVRAGEAAARHHLVHPRAHQVARVVRVALVVRLVSGRTPARSDRTGSRRLCRLAQSVVAEDWAARACSTARQEQIGQP
jgi:hypothetical protein